MKYFDWERKALQSTLTYIPEVLPFPEWYNDRLNSDRDMTAKLYQALCSQNIPVKLTSYRVFVVKNNSYMVRSKTLNTDDSIEEALLLIKKDFRDKTGVVLYGLYRPKSRTPINSVVQYICL